MYTYYLFSKGDAIEGIVCFDEYDYFKEHLIEKKKYCFREVLITLADEKFKLLPYHYKICFTDDTTIVHLIDHDDNIPLQWYFLKKLSDISQFLHQDVQLIGTLLLPNDTYLDYILT